MVTTTATTTRVNSEASLYLASYDGSVNVREQHSGDSIEIKGLSRARMIDSCLSFLRSELRSDLDRMTAAERDTLHSGIRALAELLPGSAELKAV